MFGRKKDEEGLYTGDAPVSAPGFDGAEPTAYHGTAASTASSASPVDSQPVPAPPLEPPGSSQAGMPPAPGFGPSGMPPAPGFASGVSVGGGIPSDADLARLEQLVAQKVPPQFADLAMEQIERLRAQGGAQPGPGGPTMVGAPYGGPGYPGGPVPARTRTSGRGRMAGCLVAVLVLVAVIVGVAISIVNNVGDAVHGGTGQSAESAPTTALVGVPATATYDGATLSLTVVRAVVQPGYPWPLAYPGADPTLLVEVDMRRTDSGVDAVTVIGWDWGFTPTGGTKPITGDIIGEYQPDLTGPKLHGGETAHGWISFDTDVTAGTLTFSDATASTPSLSWTVAGTKAATVRGTLGRPAQGVISDPGFTVAVSNPRSVSGTATGVLQKPDSGRYLLLDVAIAVPTDLDGTAGQIEDDTFAFTPTGGKSLTPAPDAVAKSLGWLVLSAGQKPSGVLAFDTLATAGTLIMRDGAGHVVVSWTIAASGTPRTTAPKTTAPKTTAPKTAPKTTAARTTGPTTAAGSRRTG